MYKLYTAPTPNGWKVAMALEELRAQYEVQLIDLQSGEQHSNWFLQINPNGRIPVLKTMGKDSTIIFDSNAILIYLAEKFGELLPTDSSKRAECMSWLFWQMGSAPYLGGGFGHFYAYAPEKFEYPINRFAMEVKRQLDVLDKNLAERKFICGDDYTIADIAIAPWYGTLVLRNIYKAAEFLDVASYENVVRWATEVSDREAYKRGSRVNRSPDQLKDNAILERHDASDLD